MHGFCIELNLFLKKTTTATTHYRNIIATKHQKHQHKHFPIGSALTTCLASRCQRPFLEKLNLACLLYYVVRCLSCFTVYPALVFSVYCCLCRFSSAYTQDTTAKIRGISCINMCWYDNNVPWNHFVFLRCWKYRLFLKDRIVKTGIH